MENYHSNIMKMLGHAQIWSGPRTNTQMRLGKVPEKWDLS